MIPWFYVNVDENKKHEILSNLYTIEYEKLQSFVPISESIECGGTMNQMKLFNKIVNMSNFDNNDNITQSNIKACSSFNEIQNNIELDGTCVDVSLKSIEFDSFRKYENDPETGLLINVAEDVQLYDCSFYTQLTENCVLEARKLSNDSDLNRIYYILKMFENSMTFHEDRVPSSCTKLMNICLYYILLIQNATPVRDHCSKYLSHNIIGFMADAFIRSRVLTHWRNNSCRAYLMQDLVTNYSRENLLVNLCRLNTPQERVDYLKQYFQQADEFVYNLLKAIS